MTFFFKNKINNNSYNKTFFYKYKYKINKKKIKWKHCALFCLLVGTVQNFAILAKFRYDSENLFSLPLRNFRNGCENFSIIAKISLCHSEIFLLPFLHSCFSVLQFRLQNFTKTAKINTRKIKKN